MSMPSQNASGGLRLPQRKPGRRRVAALLEAAGAVFAEKSYDAASLYDRLASLEGEAAALSADELGTRLFRLLIDFRADHPAFATLAEGGGALPARAADVRQRLRRQIVAILRC